MKTLIINKNREIKEIVYNNFNELYKKCNYKNSNNFTCLQCIKTKIGIIEFWGKRSKISYKYNDLDLYGKCIILLKKDCYIDLTIDLLNANLNDKYNNIIDNDINDINDMDNINKMDEIDNKDNKDNKDNIDINNLIINELLPEVYVYTSDEDN